MKKKLNAWKEGKDIYFEFDDMIYKVTDAKVIENKLLTSIEKEMGTKI